MRQVLGELVSEGRLLRRHSVDAAGAPVEWVRRWYRGDRSVFSTRLS